MTGSKLGAFLLAALLVTGGAKAATLSAWVEMTGEAQSVRAIEIGRASCRERV